MAQHNDGKVNVNAKSTPLEKLQPRWYIALNVRQKLFVIVSIAIKHTNSCSDIQIIPVKQLCCRLAFRACMIIPECLIWLHFKRSVSINCMIHSPQTQYVYVKSYSLTKRRVGYGTFGFWFHIRQLQVHLTELKKLYLNLYRCRISNVVWPRSAFSFPSLRFILSNILRKFGNPFGKSYQIPLAKKFTAQSVLFHFLLLITFPFGIKFLCLLHFSLFITYSEQSETANLLSLFRQNSFRFSFVI